MSNSSGISATLICTLTLFGPVATSQAADFLEVVSVTPSNVIDHEVDVKGPLDDDAIETFLDGPRLFSQAVGFEEKTVGNHNIYLNWYKIARPTTELRRILSVRDSLRGDDIHQISIESSAFLLSPAQRITSGPPSKVAEQLNYFKAYKVLDGRSINKDVKLTRTLGRGDRTVTKPIFFCVPVEEWHHDQHFPIKDSDNCMLVYEMLPNQQNGSVTTIDQFGLNKLKIDANKWLCVPATIVDRNDR